MLSSVPLCGERRPRRARARKRRNRHRTRRLGSPARTPSSQGPRLSDRRLPGRALWAAHRRARRRGPFNLGDGGRARDDRASTRNRGTITSRATPLSRRSSTACRCASNRSTSRSTGPASCSTRPTAPPSRSPRRDSGARGARRSLRTVRRRGLRGLVQTELHGLHAGRDEQSRRREPRRQGLYQPPGAGQHRQGRRSSSPSSCPRG